MKRNRYLLPIPLFFLLCFVTSSLSGLPGRENPFVKDSEVPVEVLSAYDLSGFSEKPTDRDEQFSYVYGYMLFSALKARGFEQIDGQRFARGVLDAAYHSNALFTHEEMEQILKSVQTSMLDRAKKEYEDLANDNARMSRTFFEVNGSSDGVLTLSGGMQYRVFAAGDEMRPKISEDDTVTVEYSITTLDGTNVFSTAEHGGSETFKVSAMHIEAVRQGFCMMRPGAHYRFWVPYSVVDENLDLSSFGPNVSLVIDVVINAVKYAEPEEAAENSVQPVL